MRKLVLIVSMIWLPLLLSARDLHVKIVNGSTGQAGYAENVRLLDLGKGMTEIGSQANVSQSAIFQNIPTGSETHFLIQATKDGINYSQAFLPDIGNSDDDTWEAEITVYDISDVVSQIDVSVPFHVIYVFEDHLYIQKRMVFDNRSNPPVTYQKKNGTIKLHLPEDMDQLDYVTIKTGSMPLKTHTQMVDGINVLMQPLKPGLTEVNVAYYLPYSGNKEELIENIYYDIEHFHLYVMPPDIKISAEGLLMQGIDEARQVATYTKENLKAGDIIKLKLSGRGMSEQELSHSQSNGKIIVQSRMSFEQHILISAVILFLAVAVLLIALRKENQLEIMSRKDNLLQAKHSLLQQMAELEASGASQELKNNLKNRLISVYRALEENQNN